MVTIGKKRHLINKNAMVFTFFLLLSVVFWFLNALGKEYTTEIDYPVSFVNLVNTQTFVGEKNTFVKLKVTGLGFTLFQYKYSYALIPFNIDLQANKPVRLKNTDKYSYFLHSSQLIRQLAGHIGSELKLYSILPDTLFFKLDQLEQKKVPIFLDSKVTCKRQYMQINRPISIPDSLEIFGPKSVLDTLMSVKTKFVNFQNVSSSFYKEIDIIPYDNIKFAQNKVKVFISVEKFTEAKIKIPIKILNAPTKGRIFIFPNEVTVSFIISLNDYLSIKNKKDRFRAVVNYDAKSKNLPRMKIKITQFPASVRISRQNSLYVSYFIQNLKNKPKAN